MKRIIFASLLFFLMPFVCMAVDFDKKYDLTWGDIDNSWGVADSFHDDYKYFLIHVREFFVPERNVFNVTMNEFYRACINGQYDVIVNVKKEKPNNKSFKITKQKCSFLTDMTFRRVRQLSGYILEAGNQELYKIALMELNAEQSCYLTSYEGDTPGYGLDKNLSNVKCDLSSGRCVVNRVFVSHSDKNWLRNVFSYCCTNNMEQSIVIDRINISTNGTGLTLDDYDNNCILTWGNQ